MIQFVLASASPRRRELMTQAGFVYEVDPSMADESITLSEPEAVVCELSFKKAGEVAERRLHNEVDSSKVFIGADTVVALDGQILGKPKDEAVAFLMLSSLQGRTHQVYTGVTLLRLIDGRFVTHTFAECTEVEVFPMSQKEIRTYIATGEPFDKAGAYGIQGAFAVHVKGIRGDYNNVVGLPIARLYQELKHWCVS